MPPEDVALAFDYGPVLAGAVSGLTLSMLLRIPAVAILVATGLTGMLAWTILGGASAPAELFQAGAARLADLAASGFLTGALLAKTAVSLVQGLAKNARRQGRR